MQRADAENRPLTLIQTKLSPPRLRRDLLHRAHLLAQLECGLEHKLTLISAPAGYGKTTLLAQWLRACPYRSAWLSLDASDSDLASFVTYTISAVRTVFPESCPSAWELLDAPQPPPIDYLVSVLVNDLAALPDSLMLALDDYHSIHDPSVHRLLAQLIQYLPDQVHLAVASRTDPPLALDRLRAGRQMLEVRAHDLRFSEREVQSYLELELERAVDPETASLLTSRTEGWIVGLHLATLWLRGIDNPTEILSSFGGGKTQFVAEYLANEVLNHQPARIRQFLLQTSVLNRFCADLCDAVVELVPGSSSALLDELDRDNLFLVSLGEHDAWYRYHHLFQEMLRATLQNKANADEIAALHCRASDWFAANGHIEDALRHALAAGAVESAVQLVEDNAHNLLNRLERHTLERWLSLLPRNAVGQRPSLLVAQAWLLYRQSRMTELDIILDTAEACLNRNKDFPDSADKRAVWGQIHALRSGTAYLLHEDFEHSIVSAERALEWLPTTERGARGTALGYWALAQQATGRQETGIRRLEETLTDPLSQGVAGTQVFLGLCLTHFMAGEMQQMLGATHRFLEFATKLQQANAIVGSHWLAGYCHYELNDLAAAARHFSQARQLRYQSNFVATFSSAIGLARIQQANNELETAQETIVGLHAEALRLNNTDLLPLVDSIQAKQALLQNDVAPALRWARALVAGARKESPFWFEQTGLTKARILVAAGADEEVQDVRCALQDQLAVAREQHRVRFVIAILAHLALAHDRLGELDQALAALEEALSLAEPGGFIRSFVDAGPQLKPLLFRMKQSSINTPYLADLLAAFGEGALPAPVLPATAPGLLLTRREEEILGLMRDGLTNKEIANQLVISVHTVKRHATNIYTKLDVRSRRQAIRKAQQSGILHAS